MVLFVSDLHYDHRPAADDPLLAGGDEAERDLIACLESHRHELEGVVLLGDLFDAWIEYRDLIPKGLTRLLGLLGRWADDGLPVTVVVGNHDPWHRDYLERHLGLEVLRRSAVRQWGGLRVAFGHGDAEERGGLGPWQRFIRSGWVHHAYAEWLPGGFGQWLARRWSRLARTRGVDPRTVSALRARATALLASGTVDAVVYGHAHQASREDLPGGIYANCGSWALERSYVLLSADSVALRHWDASMGSPRPTP